MSLQPHPLTLLAGLAFLAIVAGARRVTPARRPPQQGRPAVQNGTRTGPRRNPIDGAPPLTVRGTYLNRRSAQHRHRGIDLHGNVGAPVHATETGIVTYAGPDRVGFRAYGPQLVVVDHGGIYTLSAHLDDLVVKPGDRVTPGDVLGLVAPGVVPPHVHFEVATRPYPMPSEADRIDPSAWLRGDIQTPTPVSPIS